MNMTTPLFSVVLIAKNEANTLPRLFASLEEFERSGGEIVLVDTGSTDETVKLARSFGCLVFEEGSRFIQTVDKETAESINERFVRGGEHPIVAEGNKLFDFAAARNYAASKARNNWILMPDCDEAFTALDIAAINVAINQESASRIECDFVFAHDSAGEPLIQFRISRFYDCRIAHWNPKNIVHEVLTPIGLDAPSVYVGPEILKLEHWQNQQTNRSGYLVGLAMDCFVNPKNDRNAHYFARELFYTRRYESAIHEFYRHIAMNAWPVERAQSMVYAGDCYAALGNFERALEWWNKAFLADGTRREPLLRLGHYFYSKNDHHKTAAYASAALALSRQGFYMDNENHYRQEPHELLYWALWYLGDKAGAAYHWRKALSFQPQNPKYIHDAQFFV